ncbi:MAG: NifU family protein [Bacilli bacterium]|nr:NifU family protein [Bacilli bacterium]
MEETIEKIKDVLDSLRPFIQSDGGDIEFIKYEDNYVYIRLTGACVGCSFIDYTLEDNLYEAIKEVVPECKGVLNMDI